MFRNQVGVEGNKHDLIVATRCFEEFTGFYHLLREPNSSGTRFISILGVCDDEFVDSKLLVAFP